MGMITKAMLDVLQSQETPVRVEPVPCPEWGDTAFVYVRMLSVPEAEREERVAAFLTRQIYGTMAARGELSIADAKRLELPTLSPEEAHIIFHTNPSLRLSLVMTCTCDDAGTQLFTTADDLTWLSTQPPALIRRIHDAAWTLNGMGPEALEAAKKNSEPTLTSDSGIVWHDNGAAQSPLLSSLLVDKSS